MKLLTPLMLALSLAAFTLAGCGEKKPEAVAADAAAKPMEQAVAPSSPPKATETASAEGVHPGKAIHDANCISCHDTGVYTRADHKMTDLTMLAAQVRRCDANLGTKLFDEDIDKVTAYLNDTYYKFPKK